MKKLSAIIILVLALPTYVLAKDYKVGVVYYPDGFSQGYIDDAVVDSDLDTIKKSIASNDVYREKNGDTLQLVIQSEIYWNQTNASDGVYDFSAYKKFAEKLKARGIKWTPLFPVHHPPQWVRDNYTQDKIRNKHGQLPVDGIAGNFLDFSPSSNVWRNEAHKWIQKGIEELNSYIGVDKNSTIAEIFITNETMYRRGGLSYGDDVHKKNNINDSVITSYDNATINKWNSTYGNLGDIPRNVSFSMDSKERIDGFMRFRSEELAYMLRDLRSSAKSKLNQLGKKNIPITWKLTPYVFGAGKNTLEQYNGWNSYGLNILFNTTDVEVIGMDEYSSPSSEKSTAFIDSINKIRAYDNYDKPIYMAEFNRREKRPNADLIRKWLNDTKALDVRYWTFFSWNGGKGQSNKPTHEQPIQQEQINGLKLAFDDIIPPDGLSNEPLVTNNIDVYTPLNNSILNSSTIDFKWTDAKAENYFLYLGTSTFDYSLYNSGYIAGSILSQKINNIPTNGSKVFLTFWYKINGIWKYKTYEYATKIQNNQVIGVEYTSVLDKLYTKYSSVIGGKVGSPYFCRGGSYVCQNFAIRNIIFSVRVSDKYTEADADNKNLWFAITSN